MGMRLPGRVSRRFQFPAAGLLRAARRRADVSQLDIARAARVSKSTVARIESGTLRPSLDILDLLLGAAGFSLTVVDDEGRVLQPMLDRDDLKDGAGRRYPAHFDVIPDPVGQEWWGAIYGLARPPETYYRSKSRRDAMRRRSVWEVRVKQNRRMPEPPEESAIPWDV
jgi:transcriptional regulator with XRE-family HTH domain